jgi:hypothetical protein
MAYPHFEVPMGDIDGSNRLFVVGSAYAPGTVAVFYNGQLKRRDFFDGWAETDPATGKVTLAEAPLVGDVVQIFYLDTIPDVIGQVLLNISGTLDDTGDLTGSVTSQSLDGTIEAQSVAGTLVEQLAYNVVIVPQELTGHLCVCDETV